MEGQRGRRNGDCATVDRVYSAGRQRATRAVPAPITPPPKLINLRVFFSR